ncbi:hypothetical protein H310_03330 [Aphanomyces invadans]|uniref:Chromo domain-containing protein n=1 Tax=Aphanomyces invadans TaxID=157072 RepID=A0A024UGN7_9STRA|nr:hypothetical protein H310_03330 [Aphanomyces invadans]ETW05586.1 hypothetical protein H310_03330 [Aphanomyces invadans]|eukprot:XP_008865363.1 hypothetical protein H310_03330 [Aphanomyces invadans]
MKHYAAKDATIKQDLLDHIAYVNGGLEVEALVDYEFDRNLKQWMLLVKWRGLDEVEKTCESVTSLLKDVPYAVRSYVAKCVAGSKNMQRMDDVHGLVASRG